MPVAFVELEDPMWILGSEVLQPGVQILAFDTIGRWGDGMWAGVSMQVTLEITGKVKKWPIKIEETILTQEDTQIDLSIFSPFPGKFSIELKTNGSLDVVVGKSDLTIKSPTQADVGVAKIECLIVSKDYPKEPPILLEIKLIVKEFSKDSEEFEKIETVIEQEEIQHKYAKLIKELVDQRIK